MKTESIGHKLISLLKTSVFAILVTLPFNAYAEYYVVAGSSGCATYSTYRPVVRHHCYHRYHRVHRVHRCGYYSQCVAPRRTGSYSMTVYYPMPAYVWAPPCGGCSTTTVYTQPRYSGVYYIEQSDRLVENPYSSDSYYYYGPAVDTGTADNDIY